MMHRWSVGNINNFQLTSRLWIFKQIKKYKWSGMAEASSCKFNVSIQKLSSTVHGCLCGLSTNGAFVWFSPSMGTSSETVLNAKSCLIFMPFGPSPILQITRHALNIEGPTSNSRYSLCLCVHCIRWACKCYCGVFWASLVLLVLITLPSWMEPKHFRLELLNLIGILI